MVPSSLILAPGALSGTPSDPRPRNIAYATAFCQGALCPRRVNFEETHLRAAERLEKLIALLAMAFAGVYLVGDWLDRQVI